MKFKPGDTVEFLWCTGKKTGKIEVADFGGAIGLDWHSYDIVVEEDNTIYKHIEEDNIITLLERELRQVHITDWAIVTLPYIYGVLDNPEPAFAKLDGDRPVVLYGRVSKDPRFNPETGKFADGNRVITGVIQVIKGGEVHTGSTAYTANTAYTLGEMNDLYRRWCEEGKATPEIEQDTILRHICESCGKEVLLTSEDAWEGGWDYPPKMGMFKIVSPRTCGDCGIETSLWWEMIMRKTPIEQLDARHQRTLERILGEPESILPDDDKK